MITRELGDDDRAVALELLTTAPSGCTFPLEEASVLWDRWRLVAVVLGTFDDAGQLYSGRVLQRLDGTQVRLRAQFHRESITARGYSPTMRRSVLGFVAWLRHAGLESVSVPILPTMKGDWATVLGQLGAEMLGDRMEYTTDALEAAARA